MFDDHDTGDAGHAPDPDGVSAETPSCPPEPFMEPELAQLSDDDVEQRLCGLAAHLAVAECQMVLLVAEVDRRELWGAQGAKTCSQWLSWRIGLSPGAAREQVRVGRALERLPLMRQAFGQGRLSYSKVRALTRIATAETEEVLVDMAGYATAAQLETIAGAFRRADPAEGRTALLRRRRRYLRTFRDDDGMVVITGRLSPEDGAVVLAALESARRALAQDEANTEPPGGVSAETPEDPYGASLADALVAVCEGEARPAVQVVVHADEAVLEDQGQEGCCYAEGTGALSVHTVQRLCCDARVAKVRYRSDGMVVPEGKTREIPDRLRRAVFARDGGCRWPGCTARRFLDVHHVVWVSKGGRTRLTNLVCCCRRHHRLVHEGGYTFAMDRHARVKVVSPTGIDLTTLGRLPRAEGAGIVRRHEVQGRQLDDKTMPVGGDRLDLPLTLDVLFQRREMARMPA